MKDKSRHVISAGAWRSWLLVACVVSLAACATPLRGLPAAPTLTPATLNVTITADGKTRTYALAPDLTVR